MLMAIMPKRFTRMNRLTGFSTFANEEIISMTTKKNRKSVLAKNIPPAQNPSGNIHQLYPLRTAVAMVHHMTAMQLATHSA